MSWINKILPAGIARSDGDKRASVPEGVWTKCIKCESVLYRPDLVRNANVCPKCDHHMRLGARARLDLFLDDDSLNEIFSDIEPTDRLRFRDKKKYSARLAAAQKSTGERDALVAVEGTLHTMPIIAVAFEFGFHGGSMGQAVGEKFSRAAQLALEKRIPLICFAASGGARMQEALISLMQMAKTSAVIERMHSEGVPYISVMTDPIYGGVSASLALLGDLNIAEPDARAGFAGPNIIEQTIRQKLPKGFQRSEFLLEHGAIDMIVHRLELRDTIGRVIAKFGGHSLVIEDTSDDDQEAVDSLAAAPLASAPDAAEVEADPLEAVITDSEQVGEEVVVSPAIDLDDEDSKDDSTGDNEGDKAAAVIDDETSGTDESATTAPATGDEGVEITEDQSAEALTEAVVDSDEESSDKKSDG